MKMEVKDESGKILETKIYGEDKIEQIEQEFETNTIYDPITKTIELKVFVGKRVAVTEIKEGSFIFKIKRFIKNIFKNSDYRTISITLAEISAKKIFEYIKLISETSDDFRKELQEEKMLSMIQDGNEETVDFADMLFTVGISSAIKSSGNPEKVVRFILDDMRLDDGFDFIPCLTETQKVKIISAFDEVNPILTDAQKKITILMGTIMEENQQRKAREEFEKMQEKIAELEQVEKDLKELETQMNQS